MENTELPAKIDEQKKALILNLQRLSTEDGPGLRTTVFFKQCLLTCAWCHNPESISKECEVQWFSTRCIGCQSCIASCPKGCLSLSDQGLKIDRQGCDGCGLCTEACPTLALELMGKHVSLTELIQELVKDRVYFDKSDLGGVTASGGEPLLQADFVSELFRQLQAENIHTALDTCGLAKQSQLIKVLPFCDMVLFDLKDHDPGIHKAFTGQTNEIIFDNLLAIRNWIHEQDNALRLWIRTPLIPGATYREENILGIGNFIAQELPGIVSRWELLAFNNLAASKYERLEKNWQYAQQALMTARELENAKVWAERSGAEPAIIHTSGAVKNEN